MPEEITFRNTLLLAHSLVMTTVEGDNNKFGTNAIIYGSNGANPDKENKESSNNDEDMLDDELEIHPISPPPSKRPPNRPLVPQGYPSYPWNAFPAAPQASHFYGNPYFNLPSPYGAGWPFSPHKPLPPPRFPIAPPPTSFGKYPPPTFGKLPTPYPQANIFKNPQPQQPPSFPGNPWLAAGVGFIPNVPASVGAVPQPPNAGGNAVRPTPQGGASSSLTSGGNEIKHVSGGGNGEAPTAPLNGESNILSAGGGGQAPSITTNENGEVVLNSGGGGIGREGDDDDIAVDHIRPPHEAGGGSSSSSGPVTGTGSTGGFGTAGRGSVGVSASASAWGPWRKDSWNRNRMMAPYQYNRPY